MVSTTGTIDSQIMLYDISDTAFTNACLGNIAPCQRIRICAEMDEESYNDAIITDGKQGTYATNILGFGNILSDVIPNDPAVFGLGVEFQFERVLNADGLQIGQCVEFRIPEDWAGTLKYLTFVWAFNVSDGTTTEREIVYYPVRLIINEENTTDIQVELLDADKNPLDRICEDVECVTARYTKSIGDQFTFFPIIDADGTISEHDTYDNLNLDRLSSSLVKSSDANFDAGFVDVEISAIDTAIGSETCVKGILIPTSLPVPPPVCPCVDITLTQSILLLGTNSAKVELNYNLVSPDPLGTINIFSDQVTPFNISSSDPTGVYLRNINLMPGQTSLTITYQVDIVLANGCSYSTEMQVTSNVVVGDIQTDTANLCPTSGLCTVTISSTGQTCNYTATITNQSHVLVEDSITFHSNYDGNTLDSCLGSTNVIFYGNQDSPLGGYTYSNPVSLTTGGFFETIKIAAYFDADCSTLGDGSIVDYLTLNLSSVVYTGSDAAFATALLTEIETQISAWNIPGVGTGATNGVDYIATVDVFTGGRFIIRFLNKHNPCGLWIGIDRLDVEVLYNIDGLNPGSVGDFGVETVPAAMCHFDNVPCAQMSHYQQGNVINNGAGSNNFFIASLNISPIIYFDLPDGITATCDGGTTTFVVNNDQDCTIVTITAVAGGTTGTVTYDLEYDDGTGYMVVQTNTSGLFNVAALGNYRVMITDGDGCMATSNIISV